jgi:hypothetical protein
LSAPFKRILVSHHICPRIGFATEKAQISAATHQEAASARLRCCESFAMAWQMSSPGVAQMFCELLQIFLCFV